MAKIEVKVKIFACVCNDNYRKKLVADMKDVRIKTDHIKVMAVVSAEIAMITVVEGESNYCCGGSK